MRVEARIDRLQLQEGAKQQPRADQQQQRERDFGDDEQTAQAVLHSAGRSARILLQRFVNIGSRYLPRRRESEHNAGNQRDKDCKGENLEVEIDIVQSREILWQQPGQQINSSPREKKAERAAGECKHYAFGKQLPHNP